MAGKSIMLFETMNPRAPLNVNKDIIWVSSRWNKTGTVDWLRRLMCLTASASLPPSHQMTYGVLKCTRGKQNVPFLTKFFIFQANLLAFFIYFYKQETFF